MRTLLLLSFATGLMAQELQPRAYLPAPIGVNFFGVSYANNVGGLLFDPSLPVEDAKVNANIATLAFGQTFSLFGRTAQSLAILPYVRANLDGRLAGDQTHLYRSGLGDSTFRIAMNLHGGPAMHLKEFAAYRQRTVIGTSLTFTAPTGQYDPNRLITIGLNRWAFKPEIGVSHAYGKWAFEAAAGVWFYTPNNQFNGNNVRTQDPMGSLQGHVLRLLPRRSWVAFDGTYYTGGRSYVNGRPNSDYFGNTRLGASFGIVLSPRQSIKVSYFDGVVTRIGGDIRSIGISYNLVWLKGR
jgi:hypothetical protein